MATWTIFDKFHFGLVSGVFNLDWSVDTIKVAIIKSTVAPVEATHDFWDDLNANEVSGTNYTAGGVTLSCTEALTTGVSKLGVSADPSAWAQHASGFNDGRYAILYKSTGTASTSPLIAFADLGGTVGNQAGALSLDFDTTNNILIELS